MMRLIAGLLLCWSLFASAVQAQDKAAEYTLGAGDTIHIVVFQNPDLTLDTRVSENGTITYPLIGAVKLGGLDIAAAEKTIAQALKDGGFVQQPQVNISVLQMIGTQVSVLGQVNRPGRFPLQTMDTHLSEMLAIAGGIAPTGADVAIVVGKRDGKPFRKEVDIAGIYVDGKADADIPVRGGDVVYVHRAPVFYIYGEVQRPGSYRVERNMTVRQALAQGGGLTVRGTEWWFRLYRRGPDGKVENISPDVNDLIQPDDVLYMKEALF